MHPAQRRVIAGEAWRKCTGPCQEWRVESLDNFYRRGDGKFHSRCKHCYHASQREEQMREAAAALTRTLAHRVAMRDLVIAESNDPYEALDAITMTWGKRAA